MDSDKDERRGDREHPTRACGTAIEWKKGVRRLAVLVGCLAGCFRPSTVPPAASIPQTPALSTSPPVTTPETPLQVQQDPNPWKPDVPARDWKYIVIHHTATDSGSVESIHAAHLKKKDKHGNAWLGIGYHFLIGNGRGMPDGAVEPTFRWREQLQGAHAGVGEFNQQGIGVCLVGNFQEHAPTDAQLEAVKRLVGALRAEYAIDETGVIGHGDVKATSCPGRHFPMQEVSESYVFSNGGGAVIATDRTGHASPLRLARLKRIQR